jgi:(4S)-4-hydroxy-5-phosphonooxypentane-2,3-dione isomerase
MNVIMNQKAIYVFAKWRVKEGELEKVLSLLADVTKESVKEEGNLVYTAHQSTTDANLILLYEGYRDEQAVEVHRGSEHFQKLVVGGIVPLLAEREVVLTTLAALSIIL